MVMTFGVPQFKAQSYRSVVVSLYTAKLFEVMAMQCLFNRTFICINDPATSELTTIQRFISRVDSADAWMNRNRLNSDKNSAVVA